MCPGGGRVAPKRPGREPAAPIRSGRVSATGRNRSSGNQRPARAKPIAHKSNPCSSSQTSCDNCGSPAASWRCYWGERLCQRCGLLAEEAFEAASWPRAPWDVELVPGVWVFGRYGLCHARGDRPWHPQTFLELALEARQQGVHSVWIHESGLEPLGLPAAPERGLELDGLEWPWLAETGSYASRVPGLAGWGHWSSKELEHAFDLNIPAYVRRRGARPFAGLEDAWALYHAVSLYFEATGSKWQWRGNGAMTSDQWLRRRFRGRHAIASSAVAPPYAEGKAAEVDFQWTRAPSSTEARARWLHAFDANAAYLAAAGGVSCPAGELEHVPAGPSGVDERTPGYWRFDFREYRGPGPSPWPAVAPLWLTSPAAAYASSRWGLEPLEAWLWPEHHQYLRPWYDDLRRARAIAAEVGGPALEAVKSIYKAGLGRLASSSRARGEADELFQPYWDQAVTALARCNIHRRIVELDVEPIGVSVDCLYFLTSSPRPEAFAAKIGLPLGDGLGQYKIVGRPVAGREAREALSSSNHPAAAFRALKSLLGAR